MIIPSIFFTTYTEGTESHVYVCYTHGRNWKPCLCLLHIREELTAMFMFSTHTGGTESYVYVCYAFGRNWKPCLCLLHIREEPKAMFMFATHTGGAKSHVYVYERNRTPCLCLLRIREHIFIKSWRLVWDMRLLCSLPIVQHFQSFLMKTTCFQPSIVFWRCILHPIFTEIDKVNGKKDFCFYYKELLLTHYWLIHII